MRLQQLLPHLTTLLLLLPGVLAFPPKTPTISERYTLLLALLNRSQTHLYIPLLGLDQHGLRLTPIYSLPLNTLTLYPPHQSSQTGAMSPEAMTNSTLLLSSDQLIVLCPSIITQPTYPYLISCSVLEHRVRAYFLHLERHAYRIGMSRRDFEDGSRMLDLNFVNCLERGKGGGRKCDGVKPPGANEEDWDEDPNALESEDVVWKRLVQTLGGDEGWNGHGFDQ